jgi:hypothetical protein
MYRVSYRRGFRLFPNSGKTVLLTRRCGFLIGYGQFPSFSHCRIIFSGPTPQTKRDNIIGSFNGWDIERKTHPISCLFTLHQAQEANDHD